MRGIAVPVQSGGVLTNNPAFYFTYLYVYAGQAQHVMLQGVN